MTKYRKSSAPVTTITHSRDKIEEATDNIYKAISLIAKRSNQINLEIYGLDKLA